MKRDDESSAFLLYMEPPASEKAKEPIEDELTALVDLAMSQAVGGASNYSAVGMEAMFHPGSGFRGIHRTDCGAVSDNKDYKLENGMITNSLAPFYVRYYRESITGSDRRKLQLLAQHYGRKISI